MRLVAVRRAWLCRRRALQEEHLDARPASIDPVEREKFGKGRYRRVSGRQRHGWIGYDADNQRDGRTSLFYTTYTP